MINSLAIRTCTRSISAKSAFPWVALRGGFLNRTCNEHGARIAIDRGKCDELYNILQKGSSTKCWWLNHPQSCRLKAMRGIYGRNQQKHG
jgi:hypothetical protein